MYTGVDTIEAAKAAIAPYYRREHTGAGLYVAGAAACVYFDARDTLYGLDVSEETLERLNRGEHVAGFHALTILCHCREPLTGDGYMSFIFGDDQPCVATRMAEVLARPPRPTMGSSPDPASLAGAHLQLGRLFVRTTRRPPRARGRADRPKKK